MSETENTCRLTHVTHLSPPFHFLFVCDCESTNANSRLSPAPLSLCSMARFDMKDDITLCPQERQSLKEFFELAKGQEWTDSDNWMSEYISKCYWKGVECDASGNVEVLNLTNNALSGRLSASVGALHGLKVLDLSDNDMKVNKQLHSHDRFVPFLRFCNVTNYVIFPKLSRARFRRR